MSVNLRLLRTPRPYCDESLKGLNLRATEENGYETPSWLLSLANLREDERTQITIYTEPRWKAVSEMLNLEIPVLQDLACLHGIEGDPPKFYNMFGHVIPKYSVRVSKPKICPGCLRQGNYLRRIWDLIAYTCCPEHGTLLLDECPKCRKPISWSRGKVSFCSCGQDWREIFPPEVSESEKTLSRLIMQVCGPVKVVQSVVETMGEGVIEQTETSSNPLRNLSLAELLSSVYFVGGLQHGVVDTTGKQYAVKMRHKELHEVLTKAAAVFEDWPKNYYKFIEECRGKISIGASESGMYKDFGRLYDPLFVRKNNPLPNFMRDEFKKFITTYWDGGYAGKCSNLTAEDLSTKTYMTTHEAAVHLHVGVQTVGFLQKKGYIKGTLFPWVNRTRLMIEADSVRDLKQRWDKAITSEQAGDVFGIGRKAVVSLVNSECLVAIQGPAITKQLEWKFEVAAVDGLLKRIEDKITGKKHQNNAHRVPFYKAIQKLSKLQFEVGTFVKLILDGKMTPVAKGDGIGLSALLFDGGEIQQFSIDETVRRREGRHTMQETAKLLRTSNTETVFLVKHGFLIPEKAADGRGGSWSITREEIDRFNATYCTVGQLVDTFGTSTRGLSDRLMDQGIEPVTGPKIDGGSIYFFKKADLESIDPVSVLPITSDSTLLKMNEQGMVSTRQLSDISGVGKGTIKRMVQKSKAIPAAIHRHESGKYSSWFFSKEQVEMFKKMKINEKGGRDE